MTKQTPILLAAAVVLVTALAYMTSRSLVGVYGWGMFLIIPLIIGFCSSRIIRSTGRISALQSIIFAFGISLALVATIILIGQEGLLSAIMVLPLGILGTICGALIGHFVLVKTAASKTLAATLVLTIPLVVFADLISGQTKPLLHTQSIIEISAEPNTVWEEVIQFSSLSEPTDWLFKTGIAYPTDAKIRGRGIGAVRECMFSTGSFLEPIEIWDEPKKLEFSVQSVPAPMKEISPYANVNSTYLAGRLQSKRGQFLIVSNGENSVKLHATTWYEHNLYPVKYWKLWTDFIINRIHHRVLKHIKEKSEQKQVIALARDIRERDNIQ